MANALITVTGLSKSQAEDVAEKLEAWLKTQEGFEGTAIIQDEIELNEDEENDDEKN